MITITFDIAATVTTLHFLMISFLVGMALKMAAEILCAGFDLRGGFIKALAGTRNFQKNQCDGIRLITLILRSVILVAICFTAIALASLDQATTASVLAIIGGAPLGMTAVQLADRIL